MGFEPTEPFGSTVFKTVALNQTQPSILFFSKLENETLSWTFALPPNLASIFSQIGNKSEQQGATLLLLAPVQCTNSTVRLVTYNFHPSFRKYHSRIHVYLVLTYILLALGLSYSHTQLVLLVDHSTSTRTKLSYLTLPICN